MLRSWSRFRPEEKSTTNVPLLLAGLYDQIDANKVYYADWTGDRSTRFLTSNTGLQLSSVRIAYNFPKKMLEKIQIKSMSVWIMGDNLMVLSARRGYNPFTYMTGGNSSSQYAPLSTIVGGLKFSF